MFSSIKIGIPLKVVALLNISLDSYGALEALGEETCPEALSGAGVRTKLITPSPGEVETATRHEEGSARELARYQLG